MEDAGMWRERFSVSVNLGKVEGGEGKIDDCLHIGLDNAEEVINKKSIVIYPK